MNLQELEKLREERGSEIVNNNENHIRRVDALLIGFFLRVEMAVILFHKLKTVGAVNVLTISLEG